MSERFTGPYPEAPIEISVDMSPEAAWDLVQQLTHDEGVRSEFERDPQGALAGVGIRVSDGAFPDWARLPSEEEVQRLVEIIEPGLAPVAGGKPLPTPPSFGTCLWLSIGLAAAAKSTQGQEAAEAS